MSVPVEVVAWIVGNDSGTSSKAIVLNYYKVPADKRDLGCWPADKDDFGRCVRLLEKFPHLSLEHMKEVNSSWKAIAENFEILLDKYKDVTERLNGKYYYYGKKKSKENQEYNLI